MHIAFFVITVPAVFFGCMGVGAIVGTCIARYWPPPSDEPPPPPPPDTIALYSVTIHHDDVWIGIHREHTPIVFVNPTHIKADGPPPPQAQPNQDVHARADCRQSLDTAGTSHGEATAHQDPVSSAQVPGDPSPAARVHQSRDAHPTHTAGTAAAARPCKMRSIQGSS